MSWSIEKERESVGAAMDAAGRWYTFIGGDGRRVYGYNTAWGCGYVCYTCGHLCDCWEE